MDARHDSADAGLRNAWLAAARSPEVCARLEAIYADVAEATRRRAPRCDASGRCCHFEAYGHRLYVTGLEAAYTVSRTTAASGAQPAPSPGRVLSLAVVQESRERGDCPYLSGTLCTVHQVKPLACRTFYCDPTSVQWQQDLTEASLRRVRTLHDEFEIPYRYAEWRTLLGVLAGR